MNNNISAQIFKTKSVSVFQNGIAFFHKNSQVDASTGRVKLDELPVGTSAQKDYKLLPPDLKDVMPVIFGSVWFSSTANLLRRITVLREVVKTEVASMTLTEILSHNKDKTIQLTLKNDPSPYSGKIVSLQDGVLLVRLDKGWKQIGIETIDYFDFEENPNLFRETMVYKKNIQLDFEKRQNSVPIDLLYFQKGISWLPNYHLLLLGDNKARLSLKANVLNDAEDLTEATVNFVLGIPSFSNMEEPLFSSQTMEHFLNDLERNMRSRSSSYVRDRIERARATVNTHSRGDYTEDNPDAAVELSEEDLFFYKKENLNLPKGGRMLIHLLETDISYEDLYSVRLSKDFGRNGKISNNTVWHSLKFKNESGFPLPTGSIAFVKNQNGQMSPISQNRLGFVPVNLWARVKMTQVPDIVVFSFEEIIDRQEKTDQIREWIIIQATIEASNFKKKEITVEIEREMKGELLESDSPWTKNYSGVATLSTQNQKNEGIWVLKLKPGEQKKITYSYKLYV